MRTLLLLTFFALFFTGSAFSAVITVSNSTSSPAMYASLQQACDSAEVNDTIYIHGSTASYGDVYIRKPLTLIGAGYRPDNDQKLKTLLGSIYLSDQKDQFNAVISTSSGTSILGIEFYSVSDHSNAVPTDIFIHRCYVTNNIEIDGYGTGNVIGNWIITDNVINYLAGVSNDSYSNIIISNNLFQGSAYISYVDNSIIENNTFIANSSGNIPLQNLEAAIIRNNIFHNGKDLTTVNNSTFENNLSFSPGTGNLVNFNTGTGNTYTGNIVNQDPQFILDADPLVFSFANNYRLGATSPGKAAGTDGTDLGAYGGANPHSDTGMPRIPQVIQMSLKSSVLSQGDNIEVDFKARKQD